MDLGAAGLIEQPFRTHGRPLATLRYASFRDALNVLADTCEAPGGLALLQGPPLSGKSTIIRAFADGFPADAAIAVVNGKGMNTAGLLESALRQFGYVVEGSSPNELLGLLRVFAMQQTASEEAPILLIENTHALNPSALRALCDLAQLKVGKNSAMKIVLVSDRPIRSLLDSAAMKAVGGRLTHDFHLRPMRKDETLHFVHAKLRAAGSHAPDMLFPAAVCATLWRASGGWPGIVDRLAVLALAKAELLPVRLSSVERPVVPAGTWRDSDGFVTEPVPPPLPPELFVSVNGETVHELMFDRPRLLVGRSTYNDIAIESRFVSRHHALLVRNGDATVLLDLNSINGTFVNSRRVSSCVLAHDDVISIGNHRIKFKDPNAMTRTQFVGESLDQTIVMQSLNDARRMLNHEKTALLPALNEDG